nr:hypothetical protein [Tanacetum cinerariifolium]
MNLRPFISAIREHLGDSEWSSPVGLKLARENLQSRFKEEDSITDVENAVFDLRVMKPLGFLFIDQRSEGQSLHASRPSRLCAQAQSVDDMPSLKRAYGVHLMGVLKAVRKAQRVSSSLSDQEARRERPHEVDAPNVENLANLDGILRHFILLQNLSLTLTSVTRFDQVVGITLDCGPIKSDVKHLFGGVVQAMMSPNGSIVASLENVNGFLAVNTSLDDLMHIDFKQKGVVPKVMLHIFEEFVLLLGRHSLNNEIPCMEENPSEQSRLGIFLSKEIFKGGVIRIHNAFVHDEARPNFLKAYTTTNITFFVMLTTPMAKSLASHISLKGKSQSGAIKIGASVIFLLIV